MDSRLEEAYLLYQNQNYYQAHEVLEDYWKNQRGEEKIWTQALIQLIVALYLLEGKRLIGAKKVYQRALLNLKTAPARIGDFDLSQIQGILIKELDF